MVLHKIRVYRMRAPGANRASPAGGFPGKQPPFSACRRRAEPPANTPCWAKKHPVAPLLGLFLSPSCTNLRPSSERPLTQPPKRRKTGHSPSSRALRHQVWLRTGSVDSCYDSRGCTIQKSPAIPREGTAENDLWRASVAAGSVMRHSQSFEFSEICRQPGG
jgi:hypothetical protein